MIPFATTRISVKRDVGLDDGVSEDPFGEGYDTPSDEDPGTTVVASGIRAHISTPSGFETGNTQTEITYQLDCDPVDLTRADTVVDETTNVEYLVEWVALRPNFAGLEHIEAGLRRAEGLASE